MPPRKHNTKPGAKAAGTADEDAALDAAVLEAAIRANQAVAGSPAALRLEQEQREARERAAPDQNTCGVCGAGSAKMRCSGCATVRYCGPECQRAHWPAHKARCKELRAEAAAAAEAKAAREEEEKGEKEEEDVVHNPNTEAGNCWTCGADNPRNLCNRCKVTKYCGVACQTENWPIHKGRCLQLKAQAEEIDEAKSALKKVKSGVRKSQEEWNDALCEASGLGRIIDIERIIAAGGRVNYTDYQGIHALYATALEGHARAIGVLLRHGAQVDRRTQKGCVALHAASQNGQLKAVAALLEHGAQIDLRDNNGASPLYMACQNNQLCVVTLLLQHGAQVDLPMNRGGTPLLISAIQGHAAVAKLLIEHGCDIDFRCNSGESPLFMACQENHLEVAVLLLGKNAQVNLASKAGGTPLLVSAAMGHAAVVRLLLHAGADPLHRDNIGFSPLDVANQQNHPEVVALLEARIAELARARP